MAEQRLREQNFDLETRINVAHEALVKADVHAETLKDAPRVGFGFPAAELGEFLLKLRRADAVLVGEVLFFVYRVLLLAAVVEPQVADDDRVEHGVVVEEALVLLEDGHAALRVEHDAAGGRLQLAGKYLDEGGFARAVRADDAVAVAGGELQIDARKQHRRAELHG